MTSDHTRPHRSPSEQRLSHELIAARLELIDYATHHSIDELLVKTLDIACSFVDSPIGFFHFISEDQQTISLQQWSSRTTSDFCHTTGHSCHYPISRAGVWADAVRRKRSITHNDYNGLAHRIGLPDGHAPIIRELVVPIIRNGLVVGILGVGNKPTDYTQQDVELISYFSDIAWETIIRKRADNELARQRMIDRSLAELSALLLTTFAIEEISFMVLETSKKLTGARFGFVGSIDSASGKLVSHTLTKDIWEQCNIPDKSIVFEHFSGLWGWVLQHRQPIMTNTLDQDERATGVPEGHLPITGFLGVPVMLYDQILGIIALANPEQPFSDLDLQAAKRLATLYAFALQRRQTEEQLRQAETRKAEELELLVNARTRELNLANRLLTEEIAAKTRAEARERQNHLQLEILHAILTNTPLILIFYCSDGEGVAILDWNQTATEVLGWTKAEVLGENLFDFIPVAEEFARVEAAHRVLIKSEGSFNLINRCNTKAGDTVLISWFNNSFHDQKTGKVYVVSLGLDVTSQHAKDEDLKKSEERFRTVANHCYDWEEWRAPDGSFLFVSPSCERLTGYAPEHFLNDKDFTLAITHPDDRERIEEHFTFDHSFHQTHQMDFRIIDSQGGVRWINHCCQPVYSETGEWLGRRASNRDITERKEAQRNLEQSKNMLQQVFDGIADPLLLLRSDGTILMMNTRAETYFQTSFGEAHSLVCSHLSADSEQCSNCKILAAIAEGTSVQLERKGLFDQERTEKIFVEPLGKDSDYAGSGIVRISDISIERRMEKDLVQAAKMISLGTLVSGVAHEINNPNNFIMLNVNLVRDTWLGLQSIIDRHYEEFGDFIVAGLPYSEVRDELPNLLSGIMAGTRRIQRIVSELKEFSLPSLEKADDRIDITTVAHQAVSLINSQIRKATANFSLHCATDLPPVKGNSQKLEQVIINLLQNACQALPDTQRAIGLSTFYDSEEAEVLIRVEDEGRGIAEKDLPHVLDPFFTTKRDIGGTGLGLSVSSKIIAEHRGRIDIASKPGKGSTFTIRLPVAETGAAKTNPINLGPQSNTAPPPERK